MVEGMPTLCFFNDSDLCHDPSRGFSLIETAIVLGVVGLVIGGIWVAAASIQRAMGRNEIATVIGRANQNFINTWTGVPLADDGSHFLTFTPTLFPQSELVDASGFTGVNTYYNFGSNKVYMSPRGLVYEMYADLTTGTGVFSYTVGPVDRADCHWMAMRFLQLFPDNGGSNGSGMGQVNIYNSTGQALAYYNFGYDGFNLGQDLIDAVDGACETSRSNFFSVTSGRPR